MARWTIQVTTAGTELLARATTEEAAFVFTQGQAGSGTVDTSALETQTSVTDYAMDLAIASCSHTDSNAKVLLRLDNTGLVAGFSLYQIGLFAKIDGDDADVLYAIAQTSEPDVIPSEGDSPNYLCDYALTTIISNELSITANVDSAGYATEVWVTEILTDYATQDDLTEAGNVLGAVIATHMDDTTVHITAAERTKWNAASTNATSALEGLNRVEALLATITAIPVQTVALTYSGAVQYPTWSNYDSDKMTMSGTSSATNAGTYTATFTPNDGYTWWDDTTEAKSTTWTIANAVISGTPSQSGTLTYTGSALTASWSNYDSTSVTIGGTYSATNAGTYTATFTPKTNYVWSDDTATAKSVTWTIGKATGTLTISSTSLSVSIGDTGTITATKTGDGTLTATSSATGVATVSVSGTTVTVTPVGAGSATITVSVSGTDNCTAPANKTCSVAVFVPTLASASWSAVSTLSTAGTASTYWSVGDEKDIVVDGETLTLVIMGFNHDTKASGGTAGITFGLKNLMADTRAMNSSETNSGGFITSEMKSWLNGTLLSNLPSDLQDVVVSVKKSTSIGDESSAINTNSMKVFLYSEIEIFGFLDQSASGEGSQYAYFAAGASKIKYLSNGAGEAYRWWERSPDESSLTKFCCVQSGGTAFRYDPDTLAGVCFGLCV